MSVQNILLEEYNKNFPEKITEFRSITQAGSNRKYFRIFNSTGSVVAVYSDNIEETETFLYFTGIFLSLGLNVPEIYYVSNDKKCYFLEDLGDESLLGIVEKEYGTNGVFTEYLRDLYKKVISSLVKMQIESAQLIDFSRSYLISEFDKQSILFDLNYFRYYFVNLNGISYDEKKLQDDFEDFAVFLSEHGEKYFMFRDFQARNIMIKNDMPYFIDYQGGRRGAIQYDMASLLYQAKARIPEEIKTELFGYYIEEVKKYININEEEFTEQFYFYVYIRVLQTLGAYGFRGLIEKRTHFLESIPFGLQNLRNLLSDKPILSKYKEFSNVMEAVSSITRFETEKNDKFTVRIASFSFKKGYPEDSSGNGGGFVFDCRGILNPGRYPEYKTKTGRDTEVIEFFKSGTDIDEFVNKVIALVKPTIDNYIERGFNNLCVSFGCTGGQHRSVYCAENFLKYLKENYPEVDTILIHRELGIKE
ncbi:MAG: phosphotransferase [Bacteroidales bacterium]|jgi:aminoglycoside/choline kinase family phosphotransferase|nr:phosphotransferase [Bacteroidales bacterium]